MSFCVYALAEAPAPAALPMAAGLRAVAVGDLVAWVRELDAPKAASAESLGEHDATVRAIAGACGATLPVRFGQVFTDEAALRDALSPRLATLRATLDGVRGCVQMTLRLFADDAVERHAPPQEADGAAARARGSSGVEYLRRRRRLRDAAGGVAVATLRRALTSVVRAERLVVHARPPLVASLYHLVESSRLERYVETLAATRAQLELARVASSGPWPPYAFAADAA